MKLSRYLSLIPLGFAVGLTGCEKPITLENFDDWMPGKPKIENVWKPPTEITDFKKLFAQNCRGCHGDGNVTGASIALNDPTFLAIISPEELSNLITNGVPKTPMPAFAIRNGGQLTDEQIEILVKGILAWKDPATTPPGPLPPYAAPLGNAAAGESLYAAYLASLEKMNPRVTAQGFMTNPAFLGLVSDQHIRTLIITGRPELGIPNFQNAIPGKPLSDQDIADVVAWIVSKRLNEFGQPLTPPTLPDANESSQP